MSHKEIRVTVRCKSHPEKHAKILRVDPQLGLEFAQLMAGLLDGTSPMYIYKPGPDSPIGKCATCGGQLETTVEEVEVRGAEPKR